MKLEYLYNTGDNLYERIIRFYHFDESQTLALVKVIKTELINKRHEVALHTLNFIDPINCELTLSISSHNQGIIPLADNRFNCKMNLESYANLIAMLEDSVASSGYYWLDDDCDSDVCLLYSEGGGW